MAGMHCCAGHKMTTRISLVLFSALLAISGAFAFHVPANGLSLGHRAVELRRVCAVRRPNLALRMNIGERFVRLVKANVNDLLNKAEDPEKMLDQVVEDMQKEMVEFRKTYAEVAANQKRLDRQREQAEGLMQDWLKRAKLALEKGDEEAARAALERKNQQQELAASFEVQLRTQGAAVSNLLAQIQQLEAKITEAKAKKDQLKARAATAKVNTKINDMLSKTTSSGALEAFDRLTDKVEKMEAEAEVAAELSGDMGLNDRFRKLEASSKVDDDLAALKNMISGSPSQPAKALTSESSAKPRDPKVEEEMRKMKEMLGD